MKLSDNKLSLLAKGLVRGKEKGGTVTGAYVTYDDARDTYASEESAYDALSSLRAWGFIRYSGTPGIFIVIRAPPASFEIAKNLRKEIDAIKKAEADADAVEISDEIRGLEETDTK